MSVELTFEPGRARDPIRRWRDLVANAPREATLGVDAYSPAVDPTATEPTPHRPLVIVGFIWIGDADAGRRYLEDFRVVGEPDDEDVSEMSYVELQSIADDRQGHGVRRYSTGQYLPDLTDEAIDLFLARGIEPGAPEPEWRLMPSGNLQGYGGAIADVPGDASAFSYRDTFVEFFAGASWTDPAEDDARMGRARAWGRAMEPFGTGTYVNVQSDADSRPEDAYRADTLTRLAQLKRTYDPENVFHLNQNIAPARAEDTETPAAR